MLQMNSIVNSITSSSLSAPITDLIMMKIAIRKKTKINRHICFCLVDSIIMRFQIGVLSLESINYVPETCDVSMSISIFHVSLDYPSYKMLCAIGISFV